MAKVKEQLKIGVVGLGGRGTSLLEAVMIPMEDISIIGVCDKYEDRRMHAAQMVKEKKGTSRCVRLTTKRFWRWVSWTPLW
ncbi:MAG: hypothetical protein ACLTDS_14915 [Bianqueaceae bacterium]